MKKIFYFIFLLIFSVSCSFDNKTGIWTDSDNTEQLISAKERNNKLVKIFDQNSEYNQEKKANLSYKIKIDKAYYNKFWKQENFNSFNNNSHFHYLGKKQVNYKTSRLSKSSIFKDKDNRLLNQPLFYDNKIVFSDHKGKIYVYSVLKNKKILLSNFYKKKFKKYKKELSLIIENKLLYVSDNLGYIYSINLNSGKLLWAKNYGIPFRSNIKIVDNQIFLMNQDNLFYSINKLNGEKIWDFSSSPQFLQSNFKNNIVYNLERNNVLFVNTNGELYSINYLNKQINWFVNLKKGSSSDQNIIFNSSPLIMNSSNLIVSTGNSIKNIDVFTSNTVWEKYISIKNKPILTKKNIFLLTKNNLLICMDLSTGEIVWSRNILNRSSTNKNSKIIDKIDSIESLLLANNQLLLFSQKGYLLSFNYKNGELLSADRIIKKNLGTSPIIVDGKMYLFDTSYRLYSVH
jgi:outer membrane protein assembly factor BamB